MESRGFGQIPAEPIGVQITALVLCVAVLGLGVWGAVAGIGALTGGKAEPGSSDGPSGTPFDITVQEPEGVDDVALQGLRSGVSEYHHGDPPGVCRNRVRQRSFCFIGWERYTLQVGFYDKAARFSGVYPFLMWRRTRRNMSRLYRPAGEHHITKHEILSRVTGGAVLWTPT